MSVIGDAADQQVSWRYAFKAVAVLSVTLRQPPIEILSRLISQQPETKPGIPLSHSLIFAL